jgi:hypothetical protein
MECHHWTSVWAWADKLARPRVRADRVSLNFMVVPVKVAMNVKNELSIDHGFTWTVPFEDDGSIKTA